MVHLIPERDRSKPSSGGVDISGNPVPSESRRRPSKQGGCAATATACPAHVPQRRGDSALGFLSFNQVEVMI